MRIILCNETHERYDKVTLQGMYLEVIHCIFYMDNMSLYDS